MLLSLRNLELVHGSKPAAEAAFERCVEMLVHAGFPDAHGVRPTQGDGGLDVYAGDLADPAGVRVFQARFYPTGLTGRYRKVEQAFDRAMTSGRATKVRHWTLCVPANFGHAEDAWWQRWTKKARSRHPGVEIDRWDGGKLEHMLLQPGNAGVRQAVFNTSNVPLLQRGGHLVEVEVGRLTREQLRSVRRRVLWEGALAALVSAAALYWSFTWEEVNLRDVASHLAKAALFVVGLLAGLRAYRLLVGERRTLLDRFPDRYQAESLIEVNPKRGTSFVRREPDGTLSYAELGHLCGYERTCTGNVWAKWGTASGRRWAWVAGGSDTSSGSGQEAPAERARWIAVCDKDERHHRYLLLGDPDRGSRETMPIPPV